MLLESLLDTIDIPLHFHYFHISEDVDMKTMMRLFWAGIFFI